jgi:hypothetical protein
MPKRINTRITCASAAIDRLALETLLDIFTLASDPTSAQSTLLLSSICRHWRNLAISHMSLWTTIHNAGPDLVALFSDRSQNASLTVDYELVSETSRNVFDRRLAGLQIACNPLWRHALRINTLRLLFDARNMVDGLMLIKPVLAGTALTRLGHVRLSFWKDHFYRIMPLFLVVSAPQLHSLHISCEGPGSNSWRHGALDSSALTGCSYLREFHLHKFAFQWSEWVEVLSSLRFLEVLSLRRFLWRSKESMGFGISTQTLSLPSLHTILLEDTEVDLAFFFRALHAPSLAHLNIHVVCHTKRDSLDYPHGDHPELFPMLTDWILQGPLANTPALHLQLYSELMTHGCVFTPLYFVHQPPIASSFVIELSSSNYPSFIHVDSLLEASSPEAIVVDLQQGEHSIASDSIFSTLLRLSSTRILTLRKLNPLTVVVDLLRRVAYESNAKTVTFLPQLHTVVLELDSDCIDAIVVDAIIRAFEHRPPNRFCLKRTRDLSANDVSNLKRDDHSRTSTRQERTGNFKSRTMAELAAELEIISCVDFTE